MGSARSCLNHPASPVSVFCDFPWAAGCVMLGGMNFRKPPATRQRWSLWRRLPLLLSLLLVIGYYGGIGGAEVLLRIKSASGNPAAAIVVLGGESWTRPAHAGELYKAGRAPVVIVSGAGDTDQYVHTLRQLGVPKAALLVEDRSATTAENAQFTVKILRDHQLTNVIVVTSWYHSRRALCCFEHYAPDLHFSSDPAPRESKGWWPDVYERGRILSEYVKIAGYLFRHGVWPI